LTLQDLFKKIFIKIKSCFKIKEVIRKNLPGYILPELCLLLIITFAITFSSCEENPNDLGFNFIPSIDTTTVSYLDSETDTMTITASDYEYAVNTTPSPYMLVGNYQNYTAKSLMKFISISPDYDSSTVTSAVMTLAYGDYYFQDTTGQTAFDIFNLNTNFNFSTVVYDSVNSSNYGTVSQGSYNGIPDTTVNISLNPQMVKNWLEYAADTAYAEKNYGIILLPSMSSTTIRGFYYGNISPVSLRPYITIILTKNSVTDTIVINTIQSISLPNVNSFVIPPDRFKLQNGIAYRSILNFDLAKLPFNVIINNAKLQFTLDKANSFISPPTNSSDNNQILIRMVTDSVTKTDTFQVSAFQSDSITYTVSINQIMQRWNSAIFPNLGVSLKNTLELQNMNYFVFYSPTAAEVSRRPRLSITYTVRN